MSCKGLSGQRFFGFEPGWIDQHSIKAKFAAASGIGRIDRRRTVDKIDIVEIAIAMVIKLGDFTNFAKIGKKTRETGFEILARCKQAQKLDVPLLTVPDVCCIQLTCLAIA